MKRWLLVIILFITFSLAGCGQVAGGSAPPSDEARHQLTAAELTQQETSRESPLHNEYLMPVGPAEPAHHAFEGTLSIPEFKLNYQTHENELPRDSHAFFPAVSIDFFTHDGYLVPVQRDVVWGSGRRSYWGVIFSPGTVWSEPDDAGRSRASFPFLLVADDYNEAHNGLATFLYDQSTIASLYLQITQETAAWHRTDFWGQTPVTYEPHALPRHDQLREAFARELSRRWPVRPWSELGGMADASLLDAFADHATPSDVSLTGLVKDGTIYLQECHTRYGPFPYCQQMRHGVFSVTKSMGASIALLRLAQKYGDQVYQLKLADYVEVTADHDGWQEVTFGDALNMASGVGEHLPQPVEPNVMHGDEDQEKFMRFMRADSAQEKLAIAFSYDSYPWGPGEIARYNSINTFILSAAMDRFLKSQEGKGADIWSMVLEEVYRPIGVLHAPIMRTLEPDGQSGLPVFGYGLYVTVDDVAKISQLLQDEGQYRGQQLLHPDMLAESLYQSERSGFPAGQRNPAGEFRYQLSYWGFPYRSHQGRPFLIPFMMGFGGNLVVLNPNGITTFRFADANNYEVDSMVQAAEALAPFPDR